MARGKVAVTKPIHDIWCGNAGDSRCVAGVGGEARPLSYDHKPMDTKERARIEAAGGFVEFNRVNGNLALSRAMGDFVFKMNDKLPQSEQIVTCDVDVVTERIGKAMEPEDICEELMNRCLSPDCQMG